MTQAPQQIEYGPFAVMAGAPWNVLDSRGVRIACCGGDSNADWERYGPPIAAAIVAALNGGGFAQEANERLVKELVKRDDRIAELEKQLSLASEAANEAECQLADSAPAENDDKPIPPRLVRHYRRAAKQQGELFCWCLENLPKFPPLEGEWIDNIKGRLVLHGGRPETKPIEESPGDLAVRESVCRGCGQPLVEDNCWMHDGCPCNSPAGVNAGNQLISDWRMHRLSRQVAAIESLTNDAKNTGRMLLAAERERDEARRGDHGG